VGLRKFISGVTAIAVVAGVSLIGPLAGATAAIQYVVTRAISVPADVWNGRGDLVVSPDGSRVYVESAYDKPISVIDVGAMTVTESISVGYPTAVGLSPDGETLVVASEPDGKVTLLDVESPHTSRSVNVPICGWPAVVSPTSNVAYVASRSGYDCSASLITIKSIDMETNSVLGTMPVGHFVMDMAMSADGSRLYAVGGEGRSYVSVINTAMGSVSDTVEIGRNLSSAAVSPDGRWLYLSDKVTNGLVYVMDTSTDTVVSTIAVGADPRRVAVSQDGGRVFVANKGDNTVSVIDTVQRAVIATVGVPFGASAVKVSPSGQIFVLGSAKVSVLSIQSSPLEPRQVSASPSNGSAYVTWQEPSDDGGSAVLRYDVTSNPGGHTCTWFADSLGCTVVGLSNGTQYTFTVTATNAIGTSRASTPSDPVSFVPGNPPGAVTDVGASPGAGAAVVSWRPPSEVGDSPLTGFRVVSSPGNFECSAPADGTSCEVDGLTNGVPYLFTVYAASAAGEGLGAVSDEAVPFSLPGVPGNVRAGVKSSSSAEVRWDAASANGSAITGYVLHVSRDNGVSWNESMIGVATKINAPGVTGSAQAAWVSIAAVNAGGRSAFSDPVLVTTTGVKSSVRVSVVDGDGVPVIGGAITWAMSNGAASSSKTYGLTDDGIIDFPLAPAGAVDVTVTGALTESGATVSGVFHGYLGFSSTVLQLPDAPVAARSVTVELPNGLPVPGVTVGLNPNEGQYQDSDCLEWAIGDLSPEDYCLEGGYATPSKTGGFSFSKTVQGFTFTVPRVAQTLTDANGKVVLSGFTNGQPRVDVSYDDGIITQAKSVVLRNAETIVSLDYMPWVEVSADSLAAGLGAAVTIPVSVETGDAEIASRSRLARANQGIKVTVLPPAGAGKGTCKAKLTAATNKAGKASLTVCATKSGMYRFKTEGAAAVDGVLLKVKGAAPMSPTAVTIRSLSVGTAKASWNPPAYGGGFTITNYVITATAKGKPTVTKTVAGSVKSISLTGLANATRYTVKIQAKTAKGLSDPVTLSVPVA
jgi:YVTN family beta-propeller protein